MLPTKRLALRGFFYEIFRRRSIMTVSGFAGKISRWRIQAAGFVTLCTVALLAPAPLLAETGEPEKWELKFGFIKLTDMAPLAVAYENGYFEDEGLYGRLEAQ